MVVSSSANRSSGTQQLSENVFAFVRTSSSQGLQLLFDALLGVQVH